ncbi:MAG: hypothetical protein O3B47_04260 [bacterium]|nr:hypothetical protein [bacterium]
MELSTLVAKIMTIVYISAGVSALSGKVDFKKFVEEFEKSPALTYITGLFGIIIGMLLIEHHNFWVKDWTVLVTIIGWAALIKGILLIVFPSAILSLRSIYKNTQTWGIFIVVIGLVFGYFGFIV